MNTSSNAGPTSASATSPIPASEHATWCSGRHEDGNDFCTSRAVDVAALELEVTNGTQDGRTVLHGLEYLDSSLSLEAAAQVARALLGLVEQARTPVEHHTWCDDPEHDLANEHCSSNVVDFTSTKPDDGTVPEAGWWGWLAAPADDDLVNLVVEGRPVWSDESFASVCFEVPVWNVSALRDVLEDDRGRTALNDLLKRLPR